MGKRSIRAIAFILRCSGAATVGYELASSLGSHESRSPCRRRAHGRTAERTIAAAKRYRADRRRHERVNSSVNRSKRTRTGNGRYIRPDRTNRWGKCCWPMDLGLREGFSVAAVRTSTMDGGMRRPLRCILARARQSFLGRYLRCDCVPASARSFAAQGLVPDDRHRGRRHNDRGADRVLSAESHCLSGASCPLVRHLCVRRYGVSQLRILLGRARRLYGGDHCRRQSRRNRRPALSVGTEIIGLRQMATHLGTTAELDTALNDIDSDTAPKRSRSCVNSTTDSPLCVKPVLRQPGPFEGAAAS